LPKTYFSHRISGVEAAGKVSVTPFGEEFISW